MRLVAHRFLMIAATALLAVSAGCADGEVPTAARTVADPIIGGASTSASGDPDVSQLARYDQTPVITIAWAKKWIGPEGGRLDFEGFAIEVPAGAVDKVTQFSIRLPVDPSGSDHVLAEFGPHGTFLAPVAIELPYAGTSVYGTAATVGWWDGEAWVDMGGGQTADGQRLRTETGHFSTFGTMEPRGDGVLLSGG